MYMQTRLIKLDDNTLINLCKLHALSPLMFLLRCSWIHIVSPTYDIYTSGKKKFNHTIKDYNLHAKWLHAKFEVPMLQGSNDTSAVCCFIALVSRRWYSIVMYNSLVQYLYACVSCHCVVFVHTPVCPSDNSWLQYFMYDVTTLV